MASGGTRAGDERGAWGAHQTDPVEDRRGMNVQTWLTAGLIVLAGAAQYGLMVYALRDLRRRPRVRGDNKALWALVVLCIPFAGALAYAVYGPTSFRDRPLPPPAHPDRRPGLPSRVSWLPDQPSLDDAWSDPGARPERRREPRRDPSDRPDRHRAA